MAEIKCYMYYFGNVKSTKDFKPGLAKIRFVLQNDYLGLSEEDEFW